MAYELAFIGAGNMAEAIARGLLSTAAMSPQQLIAADVAEARRKLFSEQLGVTTVESPAEAARDAKAILLAIKPQQMPEVLAGLGEAITEKTLIVSIAAGVTTRQIEKQLGLGKHWKVVRTMPNTPMLVGQGAVAIAAGAFATKADLAAAKTFFTPAAEVVETTEDKLDAVTALSGSGPAYVFFLLEEMIAAGIDLGLPPEQAALLAKQTVLGSATMAKTSTDTPTELRRKVTSPNGTTQAAIESLQAAHVGPAIRSAIAAACRRSTELREGAAK